MQTPTPELPKRKWTIVKWEDVPRLLQPVPLPGAAPVVSTLDNFAQALFVLRKDFDTTLGATAIEVQFPASSVLLWCITQVRAAFLAAVTLPDGTLSTAANCRISIGSAPGEGDLLAEQQLDKPYELNLHHIVKALPFATDPHPSLAYLNVDTAGATQGLGTVVVIYTRP